MTLKVAVPVIAAALRLVARIEHLALLAGMHLHCVRQRAELPGEVGCGLGVEANRDERGGGRVRRRRGALRRAAEAGARQNRR